LSPAFAPFVSKITHIFGVLAGKVDLGVSPALLVTNALTFTSPALRMAKPAKVAVTNKKIPFSFRNLEEPLMHPMYQLSAQAQTIRSGSGVRVS
jgi:hypothetical protein